MSDGGRVNGARQAGGPALVSLAVRIGATWLIGNVTLAG